jgi:hypothetical protein
MDEPGCGNCKHWQGGFHCRAYPNGIPWPIMSGEVSHMTPLPGDGGVQYERVDFRVRPVTGVLGELEKVRVDDGDE